MSRLRDVISAHDLSAAINRLALHGDFAELQVLTDDQWALYLDACGHNHDAKVIISTVVNRPIPGEANGPQS